MEPDSQSDIFKENLADFSDGELLSRWKHGNEQAAACIVERYAIRLVAMVASKMNPRFCVAGDPDDVVQSAMGSFFAAARQNRIQVSQSVSLWRLLATFTKRKMLRSIERQTTAKRGGSFERLDFDQVLENWSKDSQSNMPTTIDDLLDGIEDELPTDLREVLNLSLLGETQRDIAERLGIAERTVRRRMIRLYEALSPRNSNRHEQENDDEFFSESLPRFEYNQFVLGRMIGAGGFSKVYRAGMQSKGQETVAVKFLRKAFWRDTEAKQAFLREIDLAAKIRHPSIVRYLGWGESPHGGPYVITEWIDGISLEKLREVSAETFAGFLRTICHVLQYVHGLGIVHGDLTPSNILVDKQNHVRITDFGFSRSLQNESARTAAEIEPVLGGTIGFAAPEQISESFGQISPATDIYALGGMAYWFLTGSPPHAAATVEAAIASTISSTEARTNLIPLESLATTTIKNVAILALKKPVERRPCIAEVAEILELSSS